MAQSKCANVGTVGLCKTVTANRRVWSWFSERGNHHVGGQFAASRTHAAATKMAGFSSRCFPDRARILSSFFAVARYSAFTAFMTLWMLFPLTVAAVLRRQSRAGSTAPGEVPAATSVPRTLPAAGVRFTGTRGSDGPDFDTHTRCIVADKSRGRPRVGPGHGPAVGADAGICH